MPTDEWLSLGDAADLLGVHASTLRRWADNGRVSCRRTPGGHRRFSRRALGPLLRPDPNEAASTRSARAADQRWHDRFEAAGLVGELRALGQRASGILVAHVVRGDGSHRHLDEGRELGRVYGSQSRGAGIPLLDAVEAFLFYRSSFIDLIGHVPPTDDEASREAYRRYDRFMSEVLVGLIAGFEEAGAD